MSKKIIISIFAFAFILLLFPLWGVLTGDNTSSYLNQILKGDNGYLLFASIPLFVLSFIFALLAGVGSRTNQRFFISFLTAVGVTVVNAILFLLFISLENTMEDNAFWLYYLIVIVGIFITTFLLTDKHGIKRLLISAIPAFLITIFIFFLQFYFGLWLSTSAGH